MSTRDQPREITDSPTLRLSLRGESNCITPSHKLRPCSMLNAQCSVAHSHTCSQGLYAATQMIVESFVHLVTPVPEWLDRLLWIVRFLRHTGKIIMLVRCIVRSCPSMPQALSSFVYCKLQSTPTIIVINNSHQAHRIDCSCRETEPRSERKRKLIGRGQGYLMSSQDSGPACQRASVAAWPSSRPPFWKGCGRKMNAGFGSW